MYLEIINLAHLDNNKEHIAKRGRLSVIAFQEHTMYGGKVEDVKTLCRIEYWGTECSPAGMSANESAAGVGIMVRTGMAIIVPISSKTKEMQ